MIEKVVDSHVSQEVKITMTLDWASLCHWQLLPAKISKPGLLILRDILETRSTHQRAIEQTKDVAFEGLDLRYMVEKQLLPPRWM